MLVENFRPGVLERAGVGPDTLHEWNPDLVVLRVSGYGQVGPMRDVPAFGRAAEAMSGLAHLTGYADGPPMHPGFPAADSTTGLMGALGIMIALFAREKGVARGQVVDLAVFETLLRLMDYPVPALTGAKLSPRRNGLRQPMDYAPGGMFRTSDGVWVTVSAGSAETAQRMLPPLIAGDEKACFAVTEPTTGLDTAKLKTMAVRQGDRYVVYGQKVCPGGRQDVASGKDHTARGCDRPDRGFELVLYGSRPQFRGCA